VLLCTDSIVVSNTIAVTVQPNLDSVMLGVTGDFGSLLEVDSGIKNDNDTTMDRRQSATIDNWARDRDALQSVAAATIDAKIKPNSTTRLYIVNTRNHDDVGVHFDDVATVEVFVGSTQIEVGWHEASYVHNSRLQPLGELTLQVRVCVLCPCSYLNIIGIQWHY